MYARNHRVFFFHGGNRVRYDLFIIAKLPDELSLALHASGDRELEVVDPRTQRAYVVVDAEIHRQAMDALRRQQDREAIAQGLAEMEAGQGMPVEQACQLTRDRLLARRS